MIRAGVLVVLTGCSTATAPYEPPAADATQALGCTSAPRITPTVAMFQLTAQEYGYLDDAADAIERVLDLHESVCVPLEVYLTTWMVDRLEAERPALLDRLFSSELVSIGYQTRPPLPYRVDFADATGADYYGLSAMTASQQVEAIRRFETHGLDLAYGVPTEAAGGFARLTELYGRAPYVVSDAAQPAMQAEVDQVFDELGVTFVQDRTTARYLGETRNGVAVLPEVIEARVFQAAMTPDADACATTATGAELFECEVARCDGLGSTAAPCTVAFKAQDDDLVAASAWWLTVYRDHEPPWDPAQRAAALSNDAKDEAWARYEGVVRQATARADDVRALGARDWADAI